MAEANYHGKKAQAYWKASGAGDFSAISNLVEWSVSGTASTAESSVTQSTNFGKTREVGFKGVTATVTCNLPGDIEIYPGAIGTLELLRTGVQADGGYASAEDGAICVGADIGIDKDGIETVTYSFQFKDAVTNEVTQGTV